MENNCNENNKSSVNVIAVILAFLIGLTVGNVDMNKLRSAVNSATTNQSLISTEQTETKPTEKLKQTAETSAKTQSESTEKSSVTVYVTPTGKRYHFDPYCAGENKIESTPEEATAGGLTPCKKCAGG